MAAINDSRLRELIWETLEKFDERRRNRELEREIDRLRRDLDRAHDLLSEYRRGGRPVGNQGVESSSGSFKTILLLVAIALFAYLLSPMIGVDSDGILKTFRDYFSTSSHSTAYRCPDSDSSFHHDSDYL